MKGMAAVLGVAPAVLAWVALCAPTSERVEAARNGVVKVRVTAPTEKTGAGIVVRRSPGLIYVVTAAHVVIGADEVLVQTRDGASWPAAVEDVEYDNEAQGLALLRIAAEVAPQVRALVLAPDFTVSDGTEVFIVGHQAMSGDWGVIFGRVSNTRGREIRIQAPIEEQTSGGPVLLDDGRVIGLVQRRDPASGEFGSAVSALAIKDYAGAALPGLHAARSKGSSCIDPAGLFDLDRGDSRPALEQGDLFLNAATDTQRELQPGVRGGAQFAMIGHRDFARVTYEDLERTVYARNGFDASRGGANALAPGAVLGVRTNEGRYAKVRITSSGGDFVGFDWETFATAEEGTSPLAPNLEPCGVEARLLCGTGKLDGDGISGIRVVERSAEEALVEVQHAQNAAHGQVWIGTRLLDKDGSALSPGFIPAGASPDGRTLAKVPLGGGASRWLLVWLYDSYRSEAFACRRFDLRGF